MVELQNYVIVVGLAAIVLSLFYIILYERKRRIEAKKKEEKKLAMSQLNGRVVETQPLTTPSIADSETSSHRVVNELRVSKGYVKPETAKSKDYQRFFDRMDDGIKIDFNDLKIEMTIGSGNYGEVSRAIYTKNGETRRVACKTLKKKVPGVEDFFKEGLRMRRFDHPNVMTLIGISYPGDREPVIVTAFMQNGDLLKYIKDPKKDRTVNRLLQFAIQIAKGMEYLHGLGFIHRDLAARNCMLDDELQVKIGDFGLARECNADKMYMKNTDRSLAVAWLASESFDNTEFTMEGDVWAFGVVMWELMTYGQTPYAEIQGSSPQDWYHQLNSFLRNKGRLRKPYRCPERLYNDVMWPCWAAYKEERPVFSAIVKLVEQIAVENETVPELPAAPFVTPPSSSHDDEDNISTSSYVELVNHELDESDYLQISSIPDVRQP